MTDQTTNQQPTPATNNGTVNGIHLETLQGTVNAIMQEPDLGQCKFRARNKWLGGNHNSTTITGFYGAKQEIAHKQMHQRGSPGSGQPGNRRGVFHLYSAQYDR